VQVSRDNTLLVFSNEKLLHERSVTKRHRRKTPAPVGRSKVGLMAVVALYKLHAVQ
jgi:hypothetical protein